MSEEQDDDAGEMLDIIPVEMTGTELHPIFNAFHAWVHLKTGQCTLSLSLEDELPLWNGFCLEGLACFKACAKGVENRKEQRPANEIVPDNGGSYQWIDPKSAH